MLQFSLQCCVVFGAQCTATFDCPLVTLDPSSLIFSTSFPCAVPERPCEVHAAARRRHRLTAQPRDLLVLVVLERQQRRHRWLGALCIRNCLLTFEGSHSIWWQLWSTCLCCLELPFGEHVCDTTFLMFVRRVPHR